MMKWYTQFALFLVLVLLCSPVSANNGDVIALNNGFSYVSDQDYQVSFFILKRGVYGQFEPFYVIPSNIAYLSGWDFTIYDPSPSMSLLPNVYKIILTSSIPMVHEGAYTWFVELGEGSNCWRDPFNNCPTDDIKIDLEDLCYNVGVSLIDGYTCEPEEIVPDGEGNPDCVFVYNPNCNITISDQGYELDFGVLKSPDGTTLI